MTTVELRHAQPSDFDAGLSLLQENSLPTTDLPPAVCGHFLVALLEGREEVVGLIGLEAYGGVGLLRSLVVDAKHRGLGIAGALVEALERHALEQGVTTLFLLTTTAESYFAARGYKTLDRGDAPEAIRNTSEFSGLCPDSAAFMSKALR